MGMLLVSAAAKGARDIRHEGVDPGNTQSSLAGCLQQVGRTSAG